MTRLIVGCLTLAVLSARFIAGLSAEPANAPKVVAVTLVGEVAPLAEVLAKRKIPMDADAPATLVLVTENGGLIPLVKNENSRLFYLDKRLLHRPMQITGQYVLGSQWLLVDDVHSLKGDVLHEVYYWCEKCQLRFPHAGKCYCCGAETELWEEPVRRAPVPK